MTTLIVGGTSGLGLELARNMSSVDEHAIIAGRHNPEVGFAEYREMDLGASDLPGRIGEFVMSLPMIESLVYASGFYQEGHITDLSDEQVDTMLDVGGRGLIFFVKKLLEKQGTLDELVTITSTSQWTPREAEPVYNFVKAGAAHYSHGQSLDPRIGKTLVVGPSGMSTEFWDDSDKDTSAMMRPEWVAGRIMELREKNENYMFAKILGATGELPKRVIIEEPAPQHSVLNKVALPDDVPKTVSNLIRYHREGNGLTQTEAAKIIGVSRQQYCSYEKGSPWRSNTAIEWRPRPKTLHRIAKALDMDLETLLIAGGYDVKYQ